MLLATDERFPFVFQADQGERLQMPNNVRGRFVWHELMTTDPRAAGAFYRKVVGWKTESWPADPSYSMFAARSGAVAGYMPLPDDVKAMGAPPNWLTYIGTPDVDETASRAEDLGAEILKQPEDIPNVGRFAVLRDPQDAVFAIFTPAMGGQPRDTPELGEFSWHELATTDPAAAIEFYRTLFAWEKTEAMEMGPELGTYQMFGMGGITMGGIYRKMPDMRGPSNWLPYALVPDSKRAAGTVKSLGGQVINGPMEVPGGDWITVCMDPQGAAFAVHSKKVMAEAMPRRAIEKAVVKATERKVAQKKSAKAAVKPAPRKSAGKSAAKPAQPRKAARKPARKTSARKSAGRKAVKRATTKRAARSPARRGSARKRK
jgi:predicted enzyme related to lactoylglutathione lyase